MSGPALRWRRVAAGIYESDDGQHRIYRTDDHEIGAQGGSYSLWEHALQVGVDEWSIDDTVNAERTLRAAKAGVEKAVAEVDGGAR